MDTVLFAGYPKSGNTLIGQSFNLAADSKEVFDIYLLRRIGKIPEPNKLFKQKVCSIKTHSLWNPTKNIHDLYFGKVIKIIVINRNPFDTLLSGINFLRLTFNNEGLNARQKRAFLKLIPNIKFDNDFLEKSSLENLKEQGHLDKALKRFSEDGTSFLNYYKMSGTWSGFSSSYDYSGLPILKIRYEDLEKISMDCFDGNGERNSHLLELSSFLGVDHNKLANGFALQRTIALKEKNNTSKKVKFFNKMTSGYWREYLSLEACKIFAAKNYSAMVINGYKNLLDEIL